MHCPPSFLGEKVRYNAPCLEVVIGKWYNKEKRKMQRGV